MDDFPGEAEQAWERLGSTTAALSELAGTPIKQMTLGTNWLQQLLKAQARGTQLQLQQGAATGPSSGTAVAAAGGQMLQHRASGGGGSSGSNIAVGLGARTQSESDIAGASRQHDLVQQTPGLRLLLTMLENATSS